jgi:uncharacterized protein (DUF433 family)
VVGFSLGIGIKRIYKLIPVQGIILLRKEADTMNGLAFTATEAAAVTGLSVKAVNKAIENKLVPTKLQRYGRIRKRYLSNVGLVCLQLEAKGTRFLPLQMRRHVFRLVIQAPRQEIIRQSDALFIDLKTARQTLASGLFDLRKAKQMIIRDPEILNGMPVVRGTRVPVYLIVDLLNDGTTIQDILEGYPSLTEESVRLAQLYAIAFPKRGRPQRNARREGVVRTRRRLHAVV